MYIFSVLRIVIFSVVVQMTSNDLFLYILLSTEKSLHMFYELD